MFVSLPPIHIEEVMIVKVCLSTDRASARYPFHLIIIQQVIEYEYWPAYCAYYKRLIIANSSVY